MTGTGQDCGSKAFLLPEGLDQIRGNPAPPADYNSIEDSNAQEEAGNSWIRAHGGIEVVSDLELVIQSPRASSTILTDMRAVIDEATPRSGATVAIAQCGGVIDKRYFVLDLADGHTRLRPFAPDPDSGNSAPAISLPFKVSSTDPEVFDITLSNPQSDVKWHLELSWVADGTRGVTRIPAGGGTFRSTNAPLYIGGGAPEYLLSSPDLHPEGAFSAR